MSGLGQLAFYVRYAARSLWRGGQRTGLALACIAFGVMSLVAMQSVSSVFGDILARDHFMHLGQIDRVMRKVCIHLDEYVVPTLETETKTSDIGCAES